MLYSDAADFYGIRQTYTVLAHLRWAIKQENATVTAECLEILGSELKPLKEAEANGGLLPQVMLILASCMLRSAIRLARTFCQRLGLTALDDCTHHDVQPTDNILLQKFSPQYPHHEPCLPTPGLHISIDSAITFMRQGAKSLACPLAHMRC